MQEHRVPPVLDLLAGAAAGGTAVLLTYPLDLVRTRLAYSTEAGSAGRTAATAAPAGTLAAAPAATAAAGGSSGGAAPGGGRLLAHHQGRWATGGLALASSRGCASGACSAGGGLPLAGGAGRLAGVLVGGGGGAPSCTNRLQGQGPLGARAMHLLRLPHADPKHTIRGVLASTFQREGVRGLYHGIGASLIGILPYAGLKFYCYQHLKQVGGCRAGRALRPHGQAARALPRAACLSAAASRSLDRLSPCLLATCSGSVTRIHVACRAQQRPTPAPRSSKRLCSFATTI